MKKFAFLVCLVLMLSGCRRQPDPTPVWQKPLDGGAQAVLSGCTVLSEETAVYLSEEEPQEEGTLVRVEGSDTTLTITGAQPDAVEVHFARDTGEGTYSEDRMDTTEKVDYRLTAGEDGTLVYQLDTVYNYRILVGEDTLFVVCYREGIREP